MKKIYLVHCWEGSCEDGWYPWLANELNTTDVEVIRFDMPNTEAPDIRKWVDTLKSKVDDLNKDTFFIGHSIGCQTILRYLQEQEITKIGGMLLVAPWLKLLPKAVEDEESREIAKPWLEEPIDFEKIKRFTTNINCIFSDDDYFVPLSQTKEFEEKLNSKNTIVTNKGHISQDDGVYELSEILELSKKILEN